MPDAANFARAETSVGVRALVGDKKSILLALLFISVFVGLLADFFLTDRLFYARDMAGLEIPMRKHVVGLMKEWRLPLWTEAYGNGQPVLANPKNAIFYPTTWLYVILPFGIAFKLHFIAHAILAWLGLYALGRAFRLSQEAAFLGASSFLLGGFYLSSIEFYNHVAAFCWLPWLLLTVQSGRPRAFRTWATMALLWSLVFLAGAPHFIPLAAAFVLLTILIASDRKQARLLLALGALTLAFGLSAVQLIPAFDLLRGKSRDPQETLRWSLEPIQIVNLAIPGFLGADRGTETSEYWGSHLFDKGYPLYYSLYASPALLFLALLGLRRPRDKIRMLFIVSFVVFLFLSMLRLFPIFSLLSRIPGIGLIRYPVNYFGGALLSLSFLAAFGADELRNRIPQRSSGIFFALAFFLNGALLAALSIWPGGFLGPLGRFFGLDEQRSLAGLAASLRHGFAAMLAFSGLILLTLAIRKFQKPLFWLLAGLFIADLFVSNRGINPTISPSFFDPPAFLSGLSFPVRVYRDPTLPDRLADRIGHGLRFQKYFGASLYPYTAAGSVHYVYDRDFFSLYPQNLAAVVKTVRQVGPETRRRMLADAGCDYSISHRPLIGSGVRPLMIEGQPVYFEPVHGGRHRPYLATKMVRVRTLGDALALYDRLDFDLGSSAIVYEEFPSDDSPASLGEAGINVIEEKEGKLDCAIVTPRPALAVFAIRFDPGWVARIDGRTVDILRSNLISSGVPVPAGAHHVTLRYSPKSVRVGAGISLLTLLALVALGLISGRRSRGPVPGRSTKA